MVQFSSTDPAPVHQKWNHEVEWQGGKAAGQQRRPERELIVWLDRGAAVGVDLVRVADCQSREDNEGKYECRPDYLILETAAAPKPANLSQSFAMTTTQQNPAKSKKQLLTSTNESQRLVR